MQRQKIKKLFSESNILGFINNFDLNEKMKQSATKEQDLKTEQDKIKQLKTYDSNLFICQSYFFNYVSQNFFIFQPILNTFKIKTGLTETIVP